MKTFTFFWRSHSQILALASNGVELVKVGPFFITYKADRKLH